MKKNNKQVQVKVGCFVEKYGDIGFILPLWNNSKYVLIAVMVYFDSIKSEINMLIPQANIEKLPRGKMLIVGVYVSKIWQHLPWISSYKHLKRMKNNS